MPILQVELLKGRSLEEKRSLVQNITNAVTDTLNCSAEAVTIIIREMEHEHFAKGGILRADKK